MSRVLVACRATFLYVTFLNGGEKCVPDACDGLSLIRVCKGEHPPYVLR